MNLKKVGRNIRREVTAHPAKAAVLGVLCLVALWFWGPLVWGWIDEDDSPAASSTEESAADSPPGATAAAGSATKGTQPPQPKQTWRQLVRWMDGDRRTLATSPVLGRRDPFLTVQHEADTTELGDEPEDTTPRELTPEDLGMEFSSTIIGPDRRVAQINGKSYHEGETIRLVQDGAEIEFTLATVYPRQILLERNGEQYELVIPSPGGSGRIELYRNED